MRTRQKLTLVGALVLAGSAIGGGVLMTSHAMAADAPPPATGTLTIVSRQADAGDAVQCTYTDVALPAPPTGAGEAGVHVVQGGQDAGGLSTEGAPPPDGGSRPMVVHTSGAIGAGAGAGTGPGTMAAAVSGQVIVGTAGDVTGALPPLAGVEQARPGTAEESAALKPTAVP